MDQVNPNLERWQNYWQQNQLRWHKNEISPVLIKYGYTLLDTSGAHKNVNKVFHLNEEFPPKLGHIILIF